MRARAHGAAWRWAVVALLVAVLAALPAVLAARPASDADVSAAELRRSVLASAGVGFSGYAESAGGLSLPVGQRLTSAADLFSDRSTMRVWWRGPADHRVDVVTPTGETGVHRDRVGTWTWTFENSTALAVVPSALALPTAPDLLPTSLGRRLLSEAADEELVRIGAARVAGRDALGVRLRPAAAASSVSRVDVWIDAPSGLPLRVQLFADGAPAAALDTRFLDLDLTTPPASVTAWEPPPGAVVGQAPGSDLLADAGRRIRPVWLPASLAGLPRRELPGAPFGIGLYGRGVTVLAVTPLPFGPAGDLRRSLEQAPGAVVDDLGVRVAAGPLGLMLVQPPGREPYVLTGTVTVAALGDAAGELPGLAAGS